MRLVFSLVIVSAASVALAGEFAVSPGFRVSAGDPPTPPKAAAADYDPALPKGAKKYERARFTQSIFQLNDRDTIRPVRIRDLPDKRWHQPGGLEGVDGWKSERYRTLPEEQKVRSFIANIGVRNSFGFIQQNRGLARLYPDGTRFDELLYNTQTGKVFEHRIREKVDGKWKSYVEHKDEANFPKGYKGLKVSCTSCHSEAGSGGYAVGLVPGGDTVLSDPLPWTLWYATSPEDALEPKAAPPQALPFAPLTVPGGPACRT